MSTLLANLTEEAETYAKALYRTHQDLKTERSTSKSVKKLIEDLQTSSKHFFTLNEVESDKLKDDENLYDDKDFGALIDSLAPYASVKEVGFILDFVAKEKPETYQQAFIYRYIKERFDSFESEGIKLQVEQLTKIQQAYVTKKEALGKAPTFTELNLPKDLALYRFSASGSPLAWLYVGDKNYTSQDRQVVVGIPVANSSGRVLAIREDGTTTNLLTYAKMKSVMAASSNHSEKEQETPKETELVSKETMLANKEAMLANKAAMLADKEAMLANKEAILADKEIKQPEKETLDADYQKTLASQASVLLIKHKRYRQSRHFSSASSNTIELLKLANDQDKYKSPDQSVTYTWVYLGATHEIYHSNGKRIIFMTQNAIIGGRHLGFAEDATQVEISPEQYQQILLHGTATHK